MQIVDFMAIGVLLWMIALAFGWFPWSRPASPPPHLKEPGMSEAKDIPSVEFVSACENLRNNVAGSWSAFEYELRSVIGNTNYTAVADALARLDAALPNPEGKTPGLAALSEKDTNHG